MTAGHWLFSVQISIMVTQSQPMTASNCVQGRSNFPSLDNRPAKSEFLLWTDTESGCDSYDLHIL